MNPKFTSQFYFCPNFFSYDSYSGCSHGCKYCFGMWQSLTNRSWLCTGRNFLKPIPLSNLSLHKILKPTTHGLSKDELHLKEAIKLKMPLHIGGLSDPFQPIELKARITKRSLETLNYFDYPYIISTKNKIALEYLDYFKANKTVVQVSITNFLDDYYNLEPNASSPLERLDLVNTLVKEGIYTVVRLQPFMPWLFDDEDLEDFIIKIRRANAVTVEFLKVQAFSNPMLKAIYQDLENTLGIRFKDCYVGTPDKELPVGYKLPSLLKLKGLCSKYRLPFYSADNALRVLGVGPNCCGFPEGYFDSRYTTYQNRLPFIAKDKDVGFFDIYGTVSDLLLIKNLSTWLNTGSDYPRFKSANFLGFITLAWNNLKHPNNPANFFGNIKPTGNKEDGFLTYYHDKDWVENALSQRSIGDFFG